MSSVMSGSGLESDALGILRSITPSLDPTKHKGQAGKIAVIGGCREYTGAPYFSAISALKMGADLSHVFCTKDAAPLICFLKDTFRDEDKRSILDKVLAEVEKWMERFDCLVVGPGLGRDPFLLVCDKEVTNQLVFSNVMEGGEMNFETGKDCVSNIMKHARQSNVPIVIDGDGLFLVTNCLDLVSGYPLAILTPNVNEYKRLVQKVLECEVNDQAASEQLLSLAKWIGGVTILRKGKSDLISDGEAVRSVSIYGSPRRCGGQGDILSGRRVARMFSHPDSYPGGLRFNFPPVCPVHMLKNLKPKFTRLEWVQKTLTDVAVFVSWARQYISTAPKGELITNPTMLGCIAGSALMRKAASLAFDNKRRSTLTSDIIECLGRIWRTFAQSIDYRSIESMTPRLLSETTFVVSGYDRL
ncbi:unnamed protein product [Camellia sinensis]